MATHNYLYALDRDTRAYVYLMIRTKLDAAPEEVVAANHRRTWITILQEWIECQELLTGMNFTDSRTRKTMVEDPEGEDAALVLALGVLCWNYFGDLHEPRSLDGLTGQRIATIRRIGRPVIHEKRRHTLLALPKAKGQDAAHRYWLSVEQKHRLKDVGVGSTDTAGAIGVGSCESTNGESTNWAGSRESTNCDASANLGSTDPGKCESTECVCPVAVFRQLREVPGFRNKSVGLLCEEAEGG